MDKLEITFEGRPQRLTILLSFFGNTNSVSNHTLYLEINVLAVRLTVNDLMRSMSQKCWHSMQLHNVYQWNYLFGCKCNRIKIDGH